MIKKGIVTLALITLLLAPMHVEAHNAVKVKVNPNHFCSYGERADI